MAKVDQLEVIMPDGQVYFVDLDPARGITNIGRHPENDVIIENPRVAEFQAVLDHRQRPFSLVLLTDEGDVTLGGQRLSANTRTPLQNWDSIQVGDVAVVVVEADQPPAQAATADAAAAAKTAADTAAKGRTATKKATRAPEPVYQILGAPPPDMADDIISLELPERAFTIDVMQTAVWRLTVINGGPLVAEFHVAIDGIETPWLQLLPPKVNLNEGQRTTVTITITPPRSPASRAGNHHFAIVVTSPDYPGHKAQLGATLTVNPYYEYGVSELSPRQQTVGYLKRTGETTLTIANKGNSLVPYEVVAEDDQKGCSYEFMVPGETVGLAKQAEVRIEPDQLLMLPVRITPLKRRVIGLRKRTYSMTVTTSPMEAEQSTRSVLAQVDASPLIGPWLLLLITAICMILIALIFRPWIRTFTSSDVNLRAGVVVDRPVNIAFFSAPAQQQATDLVIQAGDSVRLSWDASPFTGLRIDPDIGAVPGPQGSIVVSPAVTTRYQLIAENLLTKISDVWFKDTKPLNVTVVPVLPKIVAFGSDKQELVTGNSATVFWQVSDATKVELYVNGAPQTLDPGQFTSNRPFKLEQDTAFTLKAYNRYNETQPVQQSFTIKVNPPTPTPIPTPGIVTFDVNPKVITAGQSVKIVWEVQGVNEVRISNIQGASTFPAQGSIEVPLQQTTVFVLSAGSGAATVSRQWQVTVNPAPPTPTPTPVPVPPTIQFFTVTPGQVVKGNPEANSITLSWAVLTGTTNIQISGPSLASPLQNLPNQGTVTIAAQQTTVFILTAFNGTLSSSANANITVIDPSPTPPPPPTATPRPTPYPPPIINSFFARADPADVNAVVQQIYTTTNSNTTVFQVKYGSHIQLFWTTAGALSVNLVGLGSQPVNGNTLSPSPLVVTGPSQYILEATNPGGTVQAFVQISLAPIPPPPPPYNVNYSNQTTSSVTINWSYDTAHIFDIIGFRVYKAPQGSGNFVRMIGEAPLVPNGPVLTNTATSWTDTNVPVCGQQYYVVAVYRDTVGNPQETAVANPTVLTQACAAASLWPQNRLIDSLWTSGISVDALAPSSKYLHRNG